ncbi:helix-turn-helix transcriptional regulator [soil metagenome]
MSSEPSLRARFAVVLRELRTSAGLSQEELGYRSGVHRTYVSQLERGLKSPTLDTVEAIADALGLRPHVIVRAAEDMSRLASDD